MIRLTALLILALVAFGCTSDGRRASDAARPDGSSLRDAATMDAATDGSLADSSTGGAAIGEACSVDTDCTNPPDAVCLTEVTNPLDGTLIASYPNGFCSKGCEESSECGTGDDVVCVTQSSSGGGGGVSSMLCTISCSDDGDCRQAEGYRCQTLLGFGFCTP